MGLLDVDDKKLQALWHRAWVESGRGFVDPRKYPYLQMALQQYVFQNGCTMDQAIIMAKTGKKTW